MLNSYNFISCDTPYDNAGIIILGAPFDGTTSFRPGARFGPSAIRGESIGIETFSPYNNKDLSDLKIHDCGDLDLPCGDTLRTLNDIKKHTEIIFADGKKPVMLGGEHLVTLGTIMAYKVINPNDDLRIIHFDAHSDLRDDYLGVKFSHACVMRRSYEELICDTERVKSEKNDISNNLIYQFGIRSGDRSEFEWAKSNFIYTKRFSFDGLADVCIKLHGKPVYLSIDLDVLDPSQFCGTGTPEAGGVNFTELLEAIQTVCRSLNVVGADLVELSPQYDQSGASTALACKLLRELLLEI